MFSLDRNQKVLILILWLVILFEWFTLFGLVYLSKYPRFISLFFAFIKLASPWFLGLNVLFLLFSLITKGVEFTWRFWWNYLIELYRFLLISFGLAAVVITASIIIGTFIGASAERVDRLPVMKQLQAWVDRHFY